MAESHLVAVQWGNLAIRYLLLECQLAVLPCWLPRVHMHFVYFNVSHFSQPHYCHGAKGCRQESARVWKVIWRLEMPVECYHFITAFMC